MAEGPPVKPKKKREGRPGGQLSLFIVYIVRCAMGFRYRKSVNVGPFRFTASKSGISTSFGGIGAYRVAKAGDIYDAAVARYEQQISDYVDWLDEVNAK